jgi:hypothetical protein
MNKRPLSVTVIACVYIATGAMGLVYHLKEFRPPISFSDEIIWISLIRILAIVCGVYMLRARNWARWVALAWMAFHVILSIFHSFSQLAMHSLLLAAFAYLLTRVPVNQYFRAGRTPAT